jgi:hypothetical protein
MIGHKDDILKLLYTVVRFVGYSCRKADEGTTEQCDSQAIEDVNRHQDIQILDRLRGRRLKLHYSNEIGTYRPIRNVSFVNKFNHDLKCQFAILYDHVFLSKDANENDEFRYLILSTRHVELDIGRNAMAGVWRMRIGISL